MYEEKKQNAHAGQAMEKPGPLTFFSSIKCHERSFDSLSSLRMTPWNLEASILYKSEGIINSDEEGCALIAESQVNETDHIGAHHGAEPDPAHVVEVRRLELI